MKYLPIAFKSNDEISRQEEIIKILHNRLPNACFFSLFKLDDGSLKGLYSHTKLGLKKSIKECILSNRIIKSRFDIEKTEQGWIKTDAASLDLSTLPKSLKLRLSSIYFFNIYPVK